MTNPPNGIYERIATLASTYAENLKRVMDARVIEMEADDNSHYLLYRVLGISTQEGKKNDEYQNKGRFLYKYAGSFLEEAAILCFKEKFPDAKKVTIPNKISTRPKTFEIDCLIDNEAIEIKWRDATTDGDHITKEHTRVQNIKDAGYKPIRIMFYYPNRKQAVRIQQTLQTMYLGIQGEYYFGESAWKVIKDKTGVDLLNILERIAETKTDD